MVFKLSSQRGFATGAASKSDVTEDPWSRPKIRKPHPGLAEAGPFQRRGGVGERNDPGRCRERCVELDEKIKRLENKIREVAKDSKIAKILLSIPGFGPVCTSELAGEIGTVERFSKEGSLALYLGMSTLDNSSGKYQGSKAPKHVNTRAKAAMMIALDRHRKYVPESQRYYEKKRAQGKKHN